jgi:hypothetical protein
MIRGIRLFTALSFLLLLAAVLAACSGNPPVNVEKLRGAPARCMTSPEGLSSLSAGQSLVEQHGKLRRSYARETSKLRCTQRYIRTITRQ